MSFYVRKTLDWAVLTKRFSGERGHLACTKSTRWIPKVGSSGLNLFCTQLSPLAETFQPVCATPKSSPAKCKDETGNNSEGSA